MALVIIANDKTARIPHRSTMESPHTATHKLPGLRKQYRKNKIYQKMKASSLISLGVLCDDRCTTTLDKKYIPVQKNIQDTIKGTINKQTGMWEVPLETQQSAAVENKFWPRQINHNYYSNFMQNF